MPYSIVNNPYYTTFKSIGLRGILKSSITSLKTRNRLGKIALHPQVITDISNQAEVNIAGYFLMGFEGGAITSPSLSKSKLSIAKEAKFVVDARDNSAKIGPNSKVRIEGEFEIGNSGFNSEATILCQDKISIGDNCTFGWNVSMVDTNRHDIYIENVKREKTNPIIIENHVWIGNTVSIKKGVTIGEGSVVASNSVVTKDVPKNTLVAGTPAEVIYENVNWRF